MQKLVIVVAIIIAYGSAEAHAQSKDAKTPPAVESQKGEDPFDLGVHGTSFNVQALGGGNPADVEARKQAAEQAVQAQKLAEYWAQKKEEEEKAAEQPAPPAEAAPAVTAPDAAEPDSAEPEADPAEDAPTDSDSTEPPAEPAEDDPPTDPDSATQGDDRI